MATRCCSAERTEPRQAPPSTPTPSVDTSPPQRCTLRLHSLTDSAARLSAAVENGRRASSRQAGADTTQRRKSGVLRGSGGRGGERTPGCRGKCQPRADIPAPNTCARGGCKSALHLHNRRDVAETNYRPSDGGGLGCKCGGLGGDFWVFFKKKIEVIVWVKLQRETNQCGARTDSEAPSANHSGRMPKLLLHLPPKKEREGGKRGRTERSYLKAFRYFFSQRRDEGTTRRRRRRRRRQRRGRRRRRRG